MTIQCTSTSLSFLCTSLPRRREGRDLFLESHNQLCARSLSSTSTHAEKERLSIIQMAGLKLWDAYEFVDLPLQLDRRPLLEGRAQSEQGGLIGHHERGHGAGKKEERCIEIGVVEPSSECGVHVQDVHEPVSRQETGGRGVRACVCVCVCVA